MNQLNNNNAVYLLENNLYGMDIYNGVIEYIHKAVLENSNIRYPIMHTLYEHKNSIYERLNYVDAKFKLNLGGVIDQYSRVVASFDNIRFSTLKYSKIKKYSIIEDILSLIEAQRTIEDRLLTEVIAKIKSIN